MLIADCLIVATALGAGVFIGADCVKLSARAKIAEARADRDLANREASEAERGMVLLAVENLRLQVNGREFWDELDAVDQMRAAEKNRADKAEVAAAAWELHAKNLSAALEPLLPPEDVEVGGNVVRFPAPGQAFQGFVA